MDSLRLLHDPAQAFRTSKSLQELDLGVTGSPPLASRSFARRPGHPSMRSIRADYNGISESGVKGLSEALVGNSVVTSLDLAGNEIDDNAALHLARYLMSAPSLRRINLRLNERITDVGANAIAGALASPRVHLHTLILEVTASRILAHVHWLKQPNRIAGCW